MVKLSGIKTWMISHFGDNATSTLHAYRMVWLIMRRKGFEPEIDLLRRFVGKGDVVVDIGANGADWTSQLSKQVTNFGKVFAFEADPYYAMVTGKVIRILGLSNVVFFPFGLSEKRESAYLSLFNDKKVRYSGMSYITRHSSKDCVPVQLYQLDELTESHKELKDVTFIKCDVEGYELYVFRGARGLLLHARPIVILEVGGWTKQGYSEMELFCYFQEICYVSHALLADGSLLELRDGFGCSEAVSANRVLIPSEKVTRYRFG